MSTNEPPHPKQGEIWKVDFNPPQGSEISKVRPAVVVSSNDVGRLPLRIVVSVLPHGKTDMRNARGLRNWSHQSATG